MSTQTNQPSIKAKKRTKIASNMAFDLRDPEREPERHWISPAELEAWGRDLVEYVEQNKECICIEEWLESVRRLPQVYYKLVEKNETLKSCHKLALNILANRRERGMVFIKYGMREKPLMMMQGLYRKQWREEIMAVAAGLDPSDFSGVKYVDDKAREGFDELGNPIDPGQIQTQEVSSQLLGQHHEDEKETSDARMASQKRKRPSGV